MLLFAHLLTTITAEDGMFSLLIYPPILLILGPHFLSLKVEITSAIAFHLSSVVRFLWVALLLFLRSDNLGMLYSLIDKCTLHFWLN